MPVLDWGPGTMLKNFVLTVIKLVLVIVPFALAFEHFSHEAQPLGRGSELPGYDHIVGRSLADVPASEFVKSADESELGYVSRITQIIHESTYHCLSTDNSLSLVESAVNVLAKAVGYNTNYELGLFDFKDFKCGFCSERASALTKVLQDNGIETITYGLGGHVVSRFTSGGNVFFSDPDYGVGPYRADLDFESVKTVYLNSVLPESANLVASIVTQSKAGGLYIHDKDLKKLQRARKVVGYVSDAFAVLLVLASAAQCLFFGVPRSRQYFPSRFRTE